MGKKVKEYKAGDFIFAKVKGYPAWPARVQKPNGKKYFVYFYGTGETANLSPNMIFDYADNKEKFLTKTVKRRDFNDGVKQIEHDFANNVPLEQVIGVPVEVPPAESSTNDSANDSATNDTLDDTGVDTTVADDTVAEDTTLNATQNDTAVEDSDDTGNLVIDEGKQKQTKKNKIDVKAKEKETPVKPIKEPKTPRGKGKKEEPAAKEDDSEEKKEEEIVSRSGRKIRPKRYMDEQTEENTTLPSPAPKKRRGGSPTSDKDKSDPKDKDKSDPKEKDKPDPKEKVPDKNIKQFNAVTQSELEDLKEPFKPEDPEKENILIAYLPSGQYIGVKLFQSRPNSFKNETSRLQWDKQAALNAITLKMQLEKGQITSKSVQAQLVTDLNLTDEEKATLDKERETEEKKSRVQFLKTEMKLIELDAKIKTCLSLEKADTDMCLKLLDDLMDLDIKPLMLLKHPTCLETIKRMRAYVGNTPSWELSESAALVFTKQAHRIRKQADAAYKKMKDLFTILEGLSFWEYFTNRVLRFKKVTSTLSADELLEMIHEPVGMSVTTPYESKEAVNVANEREQLALMNPEKEKQDEEKEGEDSPEKAKKKSTPAKSKKDKKEANSTSKTPVKRQSSRKLQQEEKEKETTEEPPQPEPIAEEAEATKPDDETPEKVDEPREKTPEKTPEPEKEITEGTPEEKEPEKEENGDVEKIEEEKVVEKAVENDTDKLEKTKEKESKEEVGEPRAKRSRESKKTEPLPPRSPAKRKSKF